MQKVRIDKWLWAARMFKTRSMASDACAGGHVKLNGETVRSSKSVMVGDMVDETTGWRERLDEDSRREIALDARRALQTMITLTEASSPG